MKITAFIPTTLPDDEAYGLLLSALTVVMKSVKRNNARSLNHFLRERLARREDRRALNHILYRLTQSVSRETPKPNQQATKKAERYLDSVDHAEQAKKTPSLVTASPDHGTTKANVVSNKPRCKPTSWIEYYITDDSTGEEFQVTKEGDYILDERGKPKWTDHYARKMHSR